MATQNSDWQQTTGTPADHARRRAHDARRGQRQFYFWGAALLVIGVALVPLGLALGLAVVGIVVGVVVALIGGVLSAIGGVLQSRRVGQVGSTPVVEGRNGERAGAEAGLAQVDDSAPVQVRCPSCQGLNDAVAQFCQHCGSAIPSAGGD